MDKNLAKNEIIGLIVLAVVGLIGLGLMNINLNSSKNLKNQATLLLYFDNNTERKFVGEVDQNMTMLRAIYSSSLAGNFDFKYALEQPNAVRLYSIGGKVNNTGKQWSFSLNGKPIETSRLDQTIIKSGDVIEARFK